MVEVFTKHGINGADIADCANSDAFAGLIASVPRLQAKRCFRALTAYFNEHSAAAVAGRGGGGDSKAVSSPCYCLDTMLKLHARLRHSRCLYRCHARPTLRTPSP